MIGVPWLLFINACSFGASFLAILCVRLPKATVTSEPIKPNHFLYEFCEGVRFFATHRILRTILITMCLVLLSGGVSESLNYFFVTQNLHAGPALYGLLSSATGIGLLCGAILASWGVQRIGFTRAFWLGIILLGLMEMLYARLTNFTLAFLVLSLQGIPNAALNVAMGPLLMHVTPRQYLRRTWSLLMPSMNLATMVSSLLAGYLVSTLLRTFHVITLGITIGPIDFMIMISGFVTFIGGLYAMTQLVGARSIK